MTLDGVNTDVGTLSLQLVELGGSTAGVNLTIYQSVLVVSLDELGVGIDSLVVLGCCCTTVVGKGLDVA